MAQAYCQVCAVEVTVREGRCLAGHLVDDTPRPSRPGRHRAKPPPATQPAPAGPLGSPSHHGLRHRSPVLEILGFAEPDLQFPTRAEPAPPPAASVSPRPERGTVQTMSQIDLREIRLADLATDEEEEVDTGRLIQRLWEASDADRVENDGSLAPEEFSATARSPRSFRWSVVILVLLLVAGASSLVVAATRIPENQAQAVAARYRASLTGLQEVMVPATEAAHVITDPTAQSDRLSEAVVPLTRLEARALEAASVATAPLPAPPPLAFREPIEAMVPVRQELQRAAQQAQTVADRLTAVLDYRLLMARAFRLPPLPLSASPDEISELGVDLAVALADTIDILSRLPDEPTFDAHRRRADETVRTLEELQADYLDALRREDVDQATGLVAEINRQVAGIRDLSDPLTEAGAWSEQGLMELEGLLGQTTRLLDLTALD